MTGAAFVVSRTSVPDITSVWQVLEVLAIYLLFSLGSWFIFSVLLGNILFNGKAPRSNEPWRDRRVALLLYTDSASSPHRSSFEFWCGDCPRPTTLPL